MSDLSNVLLSLCATLAEHYGASSVTNFALEALERAGIKVQEYEETDGERSLDILITLKLMDVKKLNGKPIDIDLEDYLPSLRKPERPEDDDEEGEDLAI